MGLNTKNVAIVCGTIFATVTSLAWAITAASIYAPPLSEGQRNADILARCNYSAENRSSQFCMKLAEQRK